MTITPEEQAIGAFKISLWPELPKGGQHVGGGPRGVKVIHIPTGMTAMCDTERSQHRNKEVAMHMIEGGLTSPSFQGYRK